MPTPASPSDRDDPAAAAAGDLAQAVVERLELRVAARPAATRLGARWRVVRGVAHVDQPVGGHALGLALELERLDRLDLDLAPHEAVGDLADEHLVGRRRLLEPGGDVDRVAGRQALLGVGSVLATTSPVLTPVRAAISTP